MHRSDRYKLLVIVALGAVVLLGAGLSAHTYLRGQSVKQTTVSYVDRDLPSANHLSDLKLAIGREEPILYAYYATMDRDRFRIAHAANLRRIENGLRVLRDTFAGHPEVGEVVAGYTQIVRVADSLDRTMSEREVDWDRARELLAAMAGHASQTNAVLDRLVGSLQQEVTARGQRTRDEVSGIVWMVAAYSAGTLLLLLAVGYSLYAYLDEAAQRRRLALFPERNPHPILSLLADGNVAYANPGAMRMLQAGGCSLNGPNGLLPHDLRDRLRELTEGSEELERFEYEACGRVLACEIHPVRDDAVFHLYLSDITDRKRAEQKLIYQAYHDALTGLPNRYQFQESVALALRAQDGVAVLLITVDRFRLFVESFGHRTGDEVLVAGGARLQETLAACIHSAPGARLFRMDGAQFAVLIPRLDDPDSLDTVAREIQHAGSRPVTVREREFLLTFSIGAAGHPQDGTDAESLARNADRAMHAVKQAGGGAYRRYSADLDAHAIELLELETSLRQALERAELTLHYQPQLCLRSGRLVGLEALLRWKHPERGLVSPARFIPLAEQTGLIVPIGEWVMRTACTQAVEWIRSGLRDFFVAVNISARQFSAADLPALVERTLRQTGLDSGYLELEVTESVAMHDVGRTVATLRALHRLGVKLSIDDFGTGYSSLSYLKRFPVDRLKVDQSFVRNIATDDDDAAIVQAIVALAHSLDLAVIAEGVETEEQRGLLAALGCEQIQGYLISRPLPAVELTSFLAPHGARRVPLECAAEGLSEPALWGADGGVLHRFGGRP
jgi:diguanylate cyclase (GGDEF)-like protein